MGLKGAIANAIISKALRTVATHGEIKECKITIKNKKGEICPAYKYAIESKKNCFILESSFFDMFSLKEYKGPEKLKYHDYDGNYKIFNKDGNLKFLSLEKRRGFDEELIGKDLDKLFLFDLSGNIVGSIKEHLISLHIPIIENDAKTCSIVFKNNKLCNVKRYYSVGKECFEMNDSYSLEHIKNKKFAIKKANRKIAEVTIFRANLKNNFPRSLIVEYNDEKNEAIATLFALAIDSVCSY